MVINNLKLPIDHSIKDLLNLIIKQCGKRPTEYKILKRSTDARKGNVEFVYSVEVVFDGSSIIEDRLDVPLAQLDERPVIIGAGPAGLFAAYILARSELKPIVFERGSDVEKRTEKINLFFDKGSLDTETNIQFGEGGYGLFRPRLNQSAAHV